VTLQTGVVMLKILLFDALVNIRDLFKNFGDQKDTQRCEIDFYGMSI